MDTTETNDITQNVIEAILGIENVVTRDDVEAMYFDKYKNCDTVYDIIDAGPPIEFIDMLVHTNKVLTNSSIRKSTSSLLSAFDNVPSIRAQRRRLTV